MKALTLNLLVLLASATSFARIQGFNDDGRLNGRYARQSVVRFFEPKEACDADGGLYDAEQGACLYYGEGNTISIDGGKVEINALWGPANERSFQGRIVGVEGDVITAAEIEEFGPNGETRLVQDGCVMQVRVDADGTATSIAGENCDGRLAIDGARRK